MLHQHRRKSRPWKSASQSASKAGFHRFQVLIATLSVAHLHQRLSTPGIKVQIKGGWRASLKMEVIQQLCPLRDLLKDCAPMPCFHLINNTSRSHRARGGMQRLVVEAQVVPFQEAIVHLIKLVITKRHPLDRDLPQQMVAEICPNRQNTSHKQGKMLRSRKKTTRRIAKTALSDTILLF